MNRLPPLKSLQAFDAAARHLSFKLAAEELHVTPTAISHQVKLLEDFMQQKLFNRLVRSLSLTKAGEAYAPLVRKGFSYLELASEEVSDAIATGELSVTTTTSFATKWLMPRLSRFRQRHPGIVVRVSGTDERVDFTRHNFDLAIRYGFGDYADLSTIWVLSDKAAVVCAPSLLAAASPNDYAAAVSGGPLIHYEWSGFTRRDPNWSTWFEAAGLDGTHLPTNAVYSDEHMCIQAAIDGNGFALVGLIAAADDIVQGRLVLASSIRLPNKNYYLICPETRAGNPRVAAFREWLLEEADIFRDSPAGALIENQTVPAGVRSPDV
jgi:LysR family glycine cleavage system transcriptional activator